MGAGGGQRSNTKENFLKSRFSALNGIIIHKISGFLVA